MLKRVLSVTVFIIRAGIVAAVLVEVVIASAEGDTSAGWHDHMYLLFVLVVVVAVVDGVCYGLDKIMQPAKLWVIIGVVGGICSGIAGPALYDANRFFPPPHALDYLLSPIFTVSFGGFAGLGIGAIMSEPIRVRIAKRRRSQQTNRTTDGE